MGVSELTPQVAVSRFSGGKGGVGGGGGDSTLRLLDTPAEETPAKAGYAVASREVKVVLPEAMPASREAVTALASLLLLAAT